MMQTTNRILKSDDVEVVEGQCHLDLGHPVSSAQHSKNAVTGTAKARILDNNNEYAVIELICSCGRKTIVRCEYGDASAKGETSPRGGSAARNAQPTGTANQKKP
jgi:hypothetical protein